MDKGTYYNLSKGTHTIKLVGELRFIDSQALGSMIDSFKTQPNLSALEVDLVNTDYLDSTMLGVIGELGLLFMEHSHSKPIVYCKQDDIKRMIETMGLDQIYDMVEKPKCELDFKMLESDDSIDFKDKVVRAHEMLIKINPNNKSEFEDLIYQLKSKGSKSDE